MLKWIGGSKPDHPLADAKRAKTILAEIPAGDPIKALEEIAYWLDSLNRTEGFKLDARFDLLDQFDQIAKNHQRKLSQEYLVQRLQKFQENRLWTTVFNFWRQLGAGYISCVEGFQSGDAGALGMRADLPAVTARALRALTLQLKWLLLRYGPIDDRMWGDFGRVYLFAEAKGFADKSAQIYPGKHGVSTVRQEFVKAMMLAASSTDGLQPLQLEIAERTVAHFSSLFEFASTPNEACAYYFDLSMRKPPARMMKSVEVTPTMRFFGAGKAGAALAELHKYVVEQGVPPADVNLGGTYERAVLLEVLKHLEVYWAPTPPARSSERKRATARLTVVHGFTEVLRNAEPEESDSLDFSEPDTESWVVDNVSDGGYGAIVPSVKGDWIKVGSLVGLKPENSAHWSTGVVRRITRDDKQMRRVGIQVFAKAVIPVRVAPAAGNGSAAGAVRDGEQAVLLSTRPDNNGEVGLLVRPERYTPSQMLSMQVRDKLYLLRPARLVERGQEYDLARFKITAAAR